MRVNGCVPVGDTDMYYVSFGEGERKLVVLPGLSDGLATVKGKALLLSGVYRKFLKDYTVYMFSRKNRMPEGYTIRGMADDQALAMKNLGISKACVLGVIPRSARFIALNFLQRPRQPHPICIVNAAIANDIFLHRRAIPMRVLPQ